MKGKAIAILFLMLATAVIITALVVAISSSKAHAAVIPLSPADQAKLPPCQTLCPNGKPPAAGQVCTSEGQGGCASAPAPTPAAKFNEILKAAMPLVKPLLYPGCEKADAWHYDTGIKAMVCDVQVKAKAAEKKRTKITIENENSSAVYYLPPSTTSTAPDFDNSAGFGH